MNEPCLHKRIHGYRLATARITNAAGSCRSATGARQLTFIYGEYPFYNR